MAAPLKTFIIYARDDESYKTQLLLHLRPLVNSKMLTVWHDGNILPGEDWEKAIKKELKGSELVIVLVSVHSLNSEFIQTEELRTALDGLDAGLTRVVPVVVSPCVWKFDPVISRLQALPSAGAKGILPVSQWSDSNHAWASVVEQIGDMVQELNELRAEKERIISETKEKERIAQEQAEQRRLEQIEKERIAREQAEQRRLEQTEKERIEREQAERRRLEQTEKERIAEAERQQKAEQKRRELARAEEQRAAAELEKRRVAEQLRAEKQQAAQNKAQNPDSKNNTLYIIAPLVLVLAVITYVVISKGNISDQTGDGKDSIKENTSVTDGSSGDRTADNAYDTAIKAGTLPALRNVVTQYPNHPKKQVALGEINKLSQQCKDLVKTANAYIREGLYADAREKLKIALAIEPESNEIVNLMEKISGK